MRAVFLVGADGAVGGRLAVACVVAACAGGGRRQAPFRPSRPRRCATPGSMRTSTRSRSIRRTSRSRRSTRSGPTARRSAAGSRCRPAPPSTPPTPTPGCFRSARGSGRSSPSAVGRSRPATSSGWPTGVALRRLRMERRRPRGHAGARAAAGAAPSRSASGRSHTIPGVSDCQVCHEAGRTPVLGFSLLQLSPDRDPGAPHAEPAGAGRRPRTTWSSAGLLVGLPGAAARDAAADRRRARRPSGPRSATCTATAGTATTPTARCGTSGSSCATPRARRRARRSRAPSAGRCRSRRPGRARTPCCGSSPGHPERSALVQRMGSRWAALQMPPLGTELVDEEALALVRHWIAEHGRARTRRPRGRSEEMTLTRLRAGRGGAAACPAPRPGAGRRRAGGAAASTWCDTSGCHDCHTPLASWGRTARSPT